MDFTNKFSWIAIFSALSFLFCLASVSSAGEEEYIIEKKAVYRVPPEGKRQKIKDVEIKKAAKGAILWFAVDPDINEAMAGSESRIYFFDAQEKPLYFLSFEYAGILRDIFFSPDGKQMALDAGTGVVGDLTLYDFEGSERKASFRGLSAPVWLDSQRFVFTMDEPDAEARLSATDYAGWASVVVYDTATGKIVPVMKATETKNYMLDSVDLAKGKLQVTETSVKSKEDWADGDKYRGKKISVAIPPATR